MFARIALLSFYVSSSLIGSGSYSADIQKPKQLVRFLVSEGWAMPFGKVEKMNNQTMLARGAMKDWQEALAAKLGRRAVFVIAPFVRLPRMTNAQIADVQCLITPQWVNEDDYEWPEPFFSITEQLVGNNDQPKIHTIDELVGKSVGTVNGYHYPTLEVLFDLKKILRDDAPSEESAYLKQTRRRTNYTVMRNIDFKYRKKWIRIQLI